MQIPARRKVVRSGTAAVEFAVCFTFIMCPVFVGLLEIGRIVEIQQIAFNAAREAARSCSTGNEYLDPTGAISGLSSPYTPNVANDTLQYLQAAEPQAFSGNGSGSWATASSNTVSSGGAGYIYSDSNGELFTISFVVSNAYTSTSNSYSGSPNTSCNDPRSCNQLDQFQLMINIPYRRIALSPLGQYFSGSRLAAVVTWVSAVDYPYYPPGYLPAS